MDYAGHPSLRDLPCRYLGALESVARETAFAPGQLIFKVGDRANRFYLLKAGQVALEPAGQPPLQVLKGGEVLGWSWLFESYQWILNARALAPSQAIFLYAPGCASNASKTMTWVAN